MCHTNNVNAYVCVISPHIGDVYYMYMDAVKSITCICYAYNYIKYADVRAVFERSPRENKIIVLVSARVSMYIYVQMAYIRNQRYIVSV